MVRVKKNPWKFDGKNFYLPRESIPEFKHSIQSDLYWFIQSDLYWFPASSAQTSEEKLDWIAQITEKTWASDVVLAGLIRILDEIVGLR